MKIIKLIAVVFLVANGYVAKAQSISKSVVNTLGNTLTSTSIKLTSNAGELVTGLNGGESTGQLSSGFLPAMDLSVLSIEDDSVITLLVYPNPTSRTLNIQNKKGQQLEIIIFNELGQLLQTKKTSDMEDSMDISQFSKGIYFVSIKIVSANKTNTYKIIKK